MKKIKYLIFATFAICIVACGNDNPNEVTLKVEADLLELGNYLTIEDNEIVVKLVEADEGVKAISSSLPLNVKTSVASNFSYKFKVEVLDRNHNKICNLPDFKLDSKSEHGTKYDNVLFAGTKRATMEESTKWEEEDQKYWDLIRKEGVYISIKLRWHSSKFIDYKGSASTEENESPLEESTTDESADAEGNDGSITSTSGSEDWDALLKSYEEYVDKYISYVKKAAKGDMDALTEYPALMNKAQELGDKMKGAKGNMSASQWERYNKITMKMAKAAQEM